MSNSMRSGFTSPFFQPIESFPIGAPYPMIGMDLQSGKRDQDLTTGVGSALPELSPRFKEYYDFYTATAPQRLAEQAQQAQLSSQLTREQLASLYPYLSAAGAESTARNLAASKEFASFMKRPEAQIQDIVASKQNQMASAASAEAARAQAMAMQQDAAKRFAGSFAGKYIQSA